MRVATYARRIPPLQALGGRAQRGLKRETRGQGRRREGQRRAKGVGRDHGELEAAAATLHKALVCAITQQTVCPWTRKIHTPNSNATHEQADQARPHRRQPRLISRYVGTRKPIRFAACPRILEAFPTPVSCARPFFTTALRTAFFTTASAHGLLHHGPAHGLLHRGLAHGLLGRGLSHGLFRDGLLCGLFLGGGLLRRFLGSSFRHLSRPSQPSALSTNFAPCRCASESTFVLISRKRCTRAQHAQSVVTIELSRALGPLILHRRERSRTPFTPLQRRARFAREASAQKPTRVRSIPDFPIYCARLQESRLLVQKQRIALAERVLRASREREDQEHSSRRAYQIETTRMLIAIEFFLVDSYHIFVADRCDRRLLRASRAENDVIRSA